MRLDKVFGILPVFFGRYSSFVAPFFWNASDIYDSQLAGL